MLDAELIFPGSIQMLVSRTAIDSQLGSYDYYWTEVLELAVIMLADGWNARRRARCSSLFVSLDQSPLTRCLRQKRLAVAVLATIDLAEIVSSSSIVYEYNDVVARTEVNRQRAGKVSTRVHSGARV